MSINAAGGAEIAIGMFGGLCSEMAPPDLPEGVSPNCPDVVFAPGNVASRPCLKKVFAVPFPNGGFPFVPTVVYGKTFITPLGGIENLYLDSNGALWWEDLTNSPGTYSQLTAVIGGSYAKSCTAFGREYIAISDKLHGADVPLQWDGTNLDRVTQDGPGTPPLVASVSLPAVAMAASGAIVLTLVESDPAAQSGSGNFTRINVFTSSAVTNINVGDPLTIAGYGGASAPMNGTWTVLAVYPGTPNSLIVVSASLVSTTVLSVAAATGTVPAATMTRNGNVVTVYCAAAHQLQLGFQAQITGIGAATVGTSVTSIVVNNENLPGIATVTTSAAHGLRPGIFVSIGGVTAAAVGGGIASVARAGGITTVATNTAHGLSPGAVVTLAGVTNTSFNTTVTVLNVMSTTTFTFAQSDADATSSAGTVSITWPIPDAATPSYFEVLAAPTTTTFQVQLTYSDGTWTTGTVTYAWNGTFFVSSVISTTVFQYQQYGPDSTTNTVGTVTPFGQAAPGEHQLQVHFLTRQGYLTRPSPPAKFTANGGQYIGVSNIPIGPTNVVARVLAFTGANGSYFFYIPQPPQVNGQQVGTPTQINDNTTTSALLDFSDNTLFRSLGVSIPGNQLSQQIILDGALGFGFFASRLITWGQRNRIQNLLNLGFEGGYLPSATTLPTGWTAAGAGAGGVLAAGHYGSGWQINAAGSIFQSFYQDANGAPIATPNAKYTFRAWVKTITTTVTATISAASTGFSSTATLSGTTVGAFSEAAFSSAMPAQIPSDLILSIGRGSNNPLVDEISIIYSDTPYLDTLLYGSYVDNPEAFDGLSGKFGASQDTHKVMDFSIIRQALHLLTQDPGGRLHQTIDNGVTEPAGWTVQEVAANCGLLSAFALTKSQADDQSASGGEEWMAWASSSGARIFGGDEPWKISQEIQPDWQGAAAAGASQWSSAPGIAPQFQGTAWALNDPVARVLYFGLPLPGNSQGAPSKVYTLNYRGLNTAYEIGTTGPIRIGFSGKLIATDHSRKWSPWSLTINGAALMCRQAGQLTPVFFAGNGTVPGTLAGFGNVYTLDATKLTDDDYGQIFPLYTTYMLPSSEQEQSLAYTDAAGKKQQLGAGRKLLQYLTAFVAGTGTLTITPLCNSLANRWPNTIQRALSAAPTVDLECGGGSAIANRIALEFASSPATGTDNGFNLQRITAILKAAAHLSVRGSV